MRVCRSQLVALIELVESIDGVITVELARQAWGLKRIDNTRDKLRSLRDRGLIKRSGRGYEPVVVPPRPMTATAWAIWRLMQDGQERTKRDLVVALRRSDCLVGAAIRELEGGDDPLIVSVDFVPRPNGGREAVVYQETAAAIRSVRS